MRFTATPTRKLHSLFSFLRLTVPIRIREFNSALALPIHIAAQDWNGAHLQELDRSKYICATECNVAGSKVSKRNATALQKLTVGIERFHG